MARTLNGTSDYLDLDSIKGSVSASAGSIGGWFKPANNDAVIRAIITWRIDSSNRIELIDFNGIAALNIRARHTGGGTNKDITGSSISAGSWAHAMVTWSSAADEWKYYLNGSQVGSTATGLGTISGTPAVFYLGNDTFSEYAVGDLAEWGVWTAALTAAEVASLAKGFSPLLVRPASILDTFAVMGSASPEPGSRGNSATLGGTPAKADHPRIIYPRRRTVYKAIPAAGGSSIPVFMHHYRMMRSA